MLFDLHPKESRKDLFGRDAELGLLEESVRLKEQLIIIYGVRRVGKTSLLHVFLNEKKIPYILLDVRDAYFESGYVSLPVICERVIGEFQAFTDKLGLGRIEFGADAYESLTKTLRAIDEWCKDKKTHFVMAFDEAQYLRLGGKTRYDGVIAWSLDNLPNITYVLTGSEVGMLKDFLRYDDVKAPLYGRFKSEISVNRFDHAKSMEFLREGFREQGVEVEDEELQGAIGKIDGIAGWLTYYGHYRGVKRLAYGKAIDKVYAEGSEIVMAEIGGLLSKSRRRYLYLLKAIAEGIDSWANIKRYVVAGSGTISDTRFTVLLESLVKFGFVEKEGMSYKITDPVTAYSVRRMKP